MRNLSFLIPVCALAAGCTQAPPDPRGVGRDEALLQVTASGRADTRPDEARFTAGVETKAATAAAASAGNNEVMNRVATALDRLGVKRDDIQTRQITLSRIGYGPERGRFQANNMIEIRMRNMDRVAEAIAATTEAGANVLSGPNMTVGDPEAASRSAYASAFKAARARAEAYAGAAGMKVSRVLAIRDGGESGTIDYARDSAVMTQTAAPPPVVAPPPFRSGMNASEVRVRVDFALGPK